MRYNPPLNELIRKINDNRSPSNTNYKCAVVIVTFKSPENLVRQIKSVKRQSYDMKDLIVVLGFKDIIPNEVLKEKDVIYLFRKYDDGPAGGFYIGEKFAIKEGYRYVVQLEDDVIIYDDDLLYEMVKFARKKGNVVVRPKVKYSGTSGLSERLYNGFHFFTLIPKYIYKNIGYTYYYFYMGREDIEFAYRINKKFPILFINKFVGHPQFEPIFNKPWRSYLNARSFAYKVENGFFSYMKSIFYTSLLGLFYLWIDEFDLLKAVIYGWLDGIFLRVGKPRKCIYSLHLYKQKVYSVSNYDNIHISNTLSDIIINLIKYKKVLYKTSDGSFVLFVSDFVLYIKAFIYIPFIMWLIFLSIFVYPLLKIKFDNLSKYSL